jgi:hypothetical protein
MTSTAAGLARRSVRHGPQATRTRAIPSPTQERAMYDPTLGRFIARDPLGPAAGLAFYAYASGNPLHYLDPLGLLTVTLSICWEACKCPKAVQPTQAEVEKKFQDDLKKVLGQDVTVKVAWAKPPCYYGRTVNAINKALDATRDAYNDAVDEYNAAQTKEAKAEAQKKVDATGKAYDEQVKVVNKTPNKAGVAKTEIGVDFGSDTEFGGAHRTFGAPEQWVRVYAGYCQSLTTNADYLQYLVNVLLHEIGHLAGLPHRGGKDPATAAMRSNLSDEEIAAWLKGPAEYNKGELEAVRKYLGAVEGQK